VDCYLQQRSLFVFTEKSVLNPVLTLDFRRYTTGIMAFCFVVGTKISSTFEAEGQAEMSISKLKEIIYEKNRNDFTSKSIDANIFLVMQKALKKLKPHMI
jgi:hypothetical protein